MMKESESGINLTGTWELKEAQNGMMPNATYPPGNGNYFTFTANMFEHYQNGSLTRKGSYSLTPDTTAQATIGLDLPGGEFTNRIIFEKDTAEKTFIDVRGNELTLLRGFFPTDGGSRQTFVKKENNR